MKLLSTGTDSKTIKGEIFGVLTGILYLAPADESGEMNTCPHASNGCKSACLFTAGYAGIYKTVNEARIRKTLEFVNNRPQFMQDLINDINSLIKKAAKLKMIPVVRLNGTSDIVWESVKINGKNLMETFPKITFYDYTKDFQRMLRYLGGKFPMNYSLTFSRSESNDYKVNTILENGGNVAVVFRGGLPKKYMGKKVIDGDISDLRFNDGKNVVVGLKAKGKARKNDSGFVIDLANKRGFISVKIPMKFTMKKDRKQLTLA